MLVVLNMNISNISEEAFETLKCYLCRKYLSVGPVISISDDGKPYKCGRCKDIPSLRTIRNLCYEKVAAFLTFPCSYEPCKVKLSWDEAMRHEQFCTQRVIQCVRNGCDVIVKIEDFENHFNLHSKKVYTNSVENVSVKKYCSTVFLINNATEQYLFIMRYSQGNIYAGVLSLQPLLQHNMFSLKITCDKTYAPSIIYKSDVIEYNELEHCINCMRKKCCLEYHKFSVKYYKSGENVTHLPLVINFEALEKLLLIPAKFIYSVNIFNQCSTDNAKTSISENHDKHFDNSSLEETDEIEQESQ